MSHRAQILKRAVLKSDVSIRGKMNQRARQQKCLSHIIVCTIIQIYNILLSNPLKSLDIIWKRHNIWVRRQNILYTKIYERHNFCHTRWTKIIPFYSIPSRATNVLYYILQYCFLELCYFNLSLLFVFIKYYLALNGKFNKVFPLIIYIVESEVFLIP